MDQPKHKIALFIDYENFGSPKTLDTTRLIAKLQQRGRLLIKRAYADWCRYAAQKPGLLEDAIDLIELPRHGSRGKNSADIKLVVDALEIALTMRYIDTFVIVSGDSDFIPLLTKLRELDKHVIAAGTETEMSALLARHCDEVMHLEPQAIALPSAQPAKTPAAPKASPTPPVGQVDAPAMRKPTPPPVKTPPKSAIGLVHRALERIGVDGKQAISGQLKSKMLEIDGNFDERKLGFKQFKLFLQAIAAADRRILLRSGKGNTKGHYIVSLKPVSETPAKPASADGLATPEASVPPEPAPPARDEASPCRPVAVAAAADCARVKDCAAALLATEAKPIIQLALAIKAKEFPDDDGVSATAVRQQLKTLIDDGFLRQQFLNDRRIVSLAQPPLLLT